MGTIIDFFFNELLGMKWLHRLVGSLLTMMGLDISKHFVAAGGKTHDGSNKCC